jgi:MFS family permease
VAAPPDARDRMVARNTGLLATAQVALWAALGAVATFAVISVYELSGEESMAAVVFGMYSLAQATGARVAGRVMDRVGRRPGLAGGYVLIGVGAAIAALAVASGSTPILLVGAVVVGAGAGAALLGRAAVADMYPPERRGAAVGRLLVAGTIGAVGGPPLAGAIHSLAERAGFEEPLVAPWLAVPVLAAVALAMVLSMRPDPRELAVDEAIEGAGRRPADILRLRPALVAVASIVAVQVVMVTFMSVVPVVLHSHGSSELTVSLVVSLHLAGMFAFSSLVGAALDRWGRRPGLLVGIALTAAGVLLTLIEGSTVFAAIGLLLVGAGWSFAYIGSTAAISDLAAATERAGALGLMDLVAAVSAATGVLSGAALLRATALPVVGVVALGLLAIPVTLLATRGRPVPAGRPG